MAIVHISPTHESNEEISEFQKIWKKYILGTTNIMMDAACSNRYSHASVFPDDKWLRLLFLNQK